jgi:hypothetical protein
MPDLSALPNLTIPYPGLLTPPQIATAYNIPASDGAGMKVGIISLGGGFLQSDLDSTIASLKTAGLMPSSTASPTIQTVLLNGATGAFSGGGADGENALDIMCVATMVPAATIVIYITNVTTAQSWNDVFQRAIDDNCDVITHSWGYSEIQGTFCEAAFANAHAKKIPIVIAAGDYGSDPLNPTYGQPIGTQYPASSPYVMPIGGTHLVLNGSNQRSSETPENTTNDPGFPTGWGGGGGISRYFTVPAWQNGLTYQTYDRTTQVVGSPQNLTMRGTPDISAAMNGYLMHFNGNITAFGGTSASAPFLAGMFARLKKLTGRSLSSQEYNTLFYSHLSAFYDVTSGNNATYLNGYVAKTGWDPVVGLGTPNGQIILALLQAAPLSTTVAVATASFYAGVAITPFIPVTAAGGTTPYSFAISPALPAGLSFNTSNGQITGTPSVTHTASYFTITVTDGASTVSSKTFRLAVTLRALSVTRTVPSKIVNAIESVTPFTPVTAIGGSGAITYSVTPALPAGLSFNTSNGQITGTPTVISSPTTYSVTAQDAFGQNASDTFLLTVVGIPIVLTKVEGLVTVVQGSPVNPFTPFVATGGSGTKTFSITPALPNGMTINSTTGRITGTPSVLTGSVIYTVILTDQVGQTASGTFILRIKTSLNLIFADEQNYVYQRIFNVLGTTSTGYGSIPISKPVTPGQIVKTSDFNLMKTDIRRMTIHQEGSDVTVRDIIEESVGNLITHTLPQRLFTKLQFLTSNSDTVAENQLRRMTINTVKNGPPYWYSDWSNHSANGYIVSASYTWARPNDLNYFFNLGGSICPHITIVHESGNTLTENVWAPLVAEANATVFGKAEFLQAEADPYKEYIRIINHVKYGADSKAIVIKFKIVDDEQAGVRYRVIQATINLLAGYYGKKKGKGKGKGNWPGPVRNDFITYGASKGKKKGTVVHLHVITDFLSRYSHAELGGIQAPVPQVQLMGNYVSSPAAPIPPYNVAVDQQSDVQTIVLRNNSPTTATISLSTPPTVELSQGVVVHNYTASVISPTSLVIEPGASSSFNLSYIGLRPGYSRGYVKANSNVNDIVLFTEVNVGRVYPAEWYITTTTNAILHQDFIVDLSGGLYRDFTVEMNPLPSGYTLTPRLANTTGFRVSYNPHGSINGPHPATATVVVFPYSTELSDVIVNVPINITANVIYRNIGSWTSALAEDNAVMGISYDYIGGLKYLTIGLGSIPSVTHGGNPNTAQLRTENNFSTWEEVYRIRVTGQDRVHHINSSTCIRSVGAHYFDNGHIISYYFGTGNARHSICTVREDKIGNLDIKMNTVGLPGNTTSTNRTLTGLANAFFYYDPTVNRTTQLETPNQFVEGELTHYFAGFRSDGTIVTTLVDPNLN